MWKTKYWDPPISAFFTRSKHPRYIYQQRWAMLAFMSQSFIINTYIKYDRDLMAQ